MVVESGGWGIKWFEATKKENGKNGEQDGKETKGRQLKKWWMEKVMKKERGKMEYGAAGVRGGQRGNKRQRDGEASRGKGEKDRLNECLILQRDRQRGFLVRKCPVDWSWLLHCTSTDITALYTARPAYTQSDGGHRLLLLLIEFTYMHWINCNLLLRFCKVKGQFRTQQVLPLGLTASHRIRADFEPNVASCLAHFTG